ncbi:MAG: type II toxin-antitoxin system RelE/ParE family toxin [Bacteroidota bacterium]
MEQIKWTKLALKDLDSIDDYISQDSTYYAQKIIENILDSVKILLAHPLSGRIVPEFEKKEIRELIIGNYRIVYKIYPKKISIVRVHHAARDMSKALKLVR